MKRTFLILCALTATPAVAELPTAGYVSQYFESQCHNPDLVVPGAGRTELTSHQYLLEIIDALNAGETTYLTDLGTKSVVSVDYVNDSLTLLGDSMACCLGGEINPKNSECESCGLWTRDGVTTCPDGFVYIELANTELLTDTDTCPTGQIQHYEIPSSCSDYIY